MNLEQLLKAKRDDIIRLAARHGAYNVRLFGSAARGAAAADSDVDFLIDMEKDRSLLDLASLWQDLEDLLGCKVDVVETQGLHWYIKDLVLAEAVPL